MGYQTFPWQTGSSHSFEKLLSLSLPVLAGKKLLDVGCNAGYFCGWAAFARAARVVGIDRDPDSIVQAKEWFPECTFVCGDWNSILHAHYDIILCLSAIHYAQDQQALIDHLMRRLTPDGVLVLELGIAPGEDDAFVPSDRQIDAHTVDTRHFPTWAKLRSLLSPYAFKFMGESVPQRGDPLPRHVVHVQTRKPLAVLLMDKHYSGKSSVAAQILRPDMPRVQGETLYHNIHAGLVPVGPALKEHIVCIGNTRHMQPPAITRAICEAGLLPEFVDACIAPVGHNDFILEHYLPEEYWEETCALLEKAGFFVVVCSMYHAKTPWIRQRAAYADYEAYTAHLRAKWEFDEDAYLRANPDVADAVAKGGIPSGLAHYQRIGKKENRPLR